LAEAQGTEKLAAALRAMDESARFMLIMDKLPGYRQGRRCRGQGDDRIFGSVAAPLGRSTISISLTWAATAVASISLATLVPIPLQGFCIGKAAGLDSPRCSPLLKSTPQR